MQVFDKNKKDSIEASHALSIFTPCNIIEQCIEFQMPLFLSFIDFKKAFDSIHWESLWEIASVYGVPQQYINIFRNIYFKSHCCVKTGTGTTEMFNIHMGIRQGCILSPFLFLLAVDFIMQRVVNWPMLGIQWKEQCLTNLDFADDIVLLGET